MIKVKHSSWDFAQIYLCPAPRPNILELLGRMMYWTAQQLRKAQSLQDDMLSTASYDQS